ncbi:glycosyltransferase [Halobaculum sp. MBLA0143]|uniref:glycosyltransferase n=1 Tax=Halobaculum sp. MBLA0143 TaxID=3079933 RepID=UPI00352506EB
MARVAVVHNTLDLRGGADAVCLHACEALARNHDVTLVTLSHPPLSELDALFDTDAAGVDVVTPPAGRALGRVLAAAAPRVGPQLPARSALLDRLLARRRGEFDLVVSTANEFDVPGPSVQYVHYPQFRAAADDEGGLGNRLWSRLAVSDGLPDDARLLANSSYTAAAVERRYGRTPSVLHPPVDPIEGAAEWPDREDGVVILGRLAPDKRTLAALELVDRARERGADLSVHVVGTAAPAYREYAERVAAAVAERPHARLHRDASRAELERLLTSNKYGLSAKPGEHFGMAVAEYVAAGMVAFAPDSGGQRDVLDGDPDRLYGSPAEGATLLAAAVERGDRPRRARDRFRHERFHDRFRAVVRETLPDAARRRHTT